MATAAIILSLPISPVLFHACVLSIMVILSRCASVMNVEQINRQLICPPALLVRLFLNELLKEIMDGGPQPRSQPFTSTIIAHVKIVETYNNKMGFTHRLLKFFRASEQFQINLSLLNILPEIAVTAALSLCKYD